MHNKQQMHLLRLATPKLRYDTDKCCDFVLPLDLEREKLSHVA